MAKVPSGWIAGLDRALTGPLRSGPDDIKIICISGLWE